MTSNPNRYDICLNHNLPNQWINREPNISTFRLLCNRCKMESRQNLDLINLQDGIQMMENNRERKNKIISQYYQICLSYLEGMENSLNDLRTESIRLLDSQITQIQYWKESLDEFKKKEIYKEFYEQLNDMIKNPFHNQVYEQQIINELDRINKSFDKKIKKKLEKFRTFTTGIQMRKYLEDFLSSFNPQELQIPTQQNKISQIDPVSLIDDSISQSNECRFVGFNFTDNIMISTDGCLIKTWIFNQGKLQKDSALKGHDKRLISYIVVSKKRNSFISGDEKGTIICWQLGSFSRWNYSEKYNAHSSSIKYMILSNQSENQLITGSDDKKIKFWNVDFQNNDLTFLYVLDDHNESITGISLNQSDKILITSSNDNKIRVWEKQDNGKWQTKQIIKQPIHSQRSKLIFTKDNQFLFVSCDNQVDSLFVFEKDERCFSLKNEKTLPLIKNNCQDFNYLPINYIKEKNFYIFGQKCNIYIIEQKNDNFKLIKSFNCTSQYICGSVTNSGEYLIYNDNTNYQYFIYKLGKI